MEKILSHQNPSITLLPTPKKGEVDFLNRANWENTVPICLKFCTAILANLPKVIGYGYNMIIF